MDWTTALQEIPILIAAWVALFGIDAWRREHSGKRRLELAEDTLALFYEASDVIKVIFSRYNEHQELFNKLYAMRYRFMAQIGKDKAQQFEDLRNIVNEIALAARLLARLWPRDHFRTEEQWNEHRRQIERHEAIFWSGLVEGDRITEKLNAVISEIESTCQAVITGKGTCRAQLEIMAQQLTLRTWQPKAGRSSNVPTRAVAGYFHGEHEELPCS